jgi:hypothetical protein
MLKAIEEFAAECSIIKVYASEVLDYVVDEGVQIHGGYGYHQDYAVERAYRDSRINRIFEGTNEINRMLVTGMLLKRAARGQLGLVKAAQGVLAEVLGGPGLSNGAGEGAFAEEAKIVHNAKKIALLLMGVPPEVLMVEKQRELSPEQTAFADRQRLLRKSFRCERAGRGVLVCWRAVPWQHRYSRR